MVRLPSAKVRATIVSDGLFCCFAASARALCLWNASRMPPADTGHCHGQNQDASCVSLVLMRVNSLNSSSNFVSDNYSVGDSVLALHTIHSQQWNNAAKSQALVREKPVPKASCLLVPFTMCQVQRISDSA
ncbi:hypothetical protein V2G26_010466 [Clonostachys chloroleuca]